MKHLSILAVSAAVICLSVSTGCNQPSQLSSQMRQAVDNAVDEVYPSLVRIHVVFTRPSGGRILKGRASGSGAIIDDSGHVITNHHVAGNAARIFCRMANREVVEAELVGTDPMTDIAVLKLDLSTRPSRQSLAPEEIASFGDSDSVRVGDVVLAMGSPAGLSQSVTQGVVANTEMISPYSAGLSMEGERVGMLVRWIGHDAQIYHGNSGGPLVDLKGRIIGINEVGIGGLGGAIPSNLARSVAAQLIAGGRVKRSWTGLQVQTLLTDSEVKTGVLVGGVLEDSPAEKAGLKPGDVIQVFDGVSVHARVEEELPLFHRVALSTPIGETVEVVAIRDGKQQSFQLTTEAREPVRDKDAELGSWGFTARDLTMFDAIQRQRPNKDGVLINTMREGGPALQAKPRLEPGDIITSLESKPVESVGDLADRSREILEGKTHRVPVLVGFDRGNRKLLTVVEIGEDPENPVTPEARKAWLAIDAQVLTRKLAKALNMPGKRGVRVTMVYPGKGPEKAGLEVGDIVLRFDEEIIDASEPEDTQVLDQMVRNYRIGDEVPLDIVRDGEKKTIVVKLDAPPTPTAELDTYENKDLEFSARDLSFDDRVEEKLDETSRGVLISDVKRSGWADLGGLASGDVLIQIDGKTVDNIRTLETIMGQLAEKQPRRIVFFVKRGVATAYLEVEPDWDAEK
ncbi:MAG: PDZ domain-containing protein [Phycisphaerae bacterium]